MLKRVALVIGIGFLALCVLGFCVGSPLYYSDKFGSGPGSGIPTPTPMPIVAERQTEPHTCGLCSLVAIYKAYGLDPEADRLRFRLGTDKPLANFIPTSKGTVHPDMLRVLSQDGLRATVLRPSSEGTMLALTEHLDAGHPAMALVKVNEFHWVVLGERAGDAVVVHDSLHDEPYQKRMTEYLRDEVYSLVLVRPDRR